MERHRLQHLVMTSALRTLDTRCLRVLHVAPEPCLRAIFARRFERYETADISSADVDHHIDLRRVSFPDASFDLVFASHVLEHIKEDDEALREIRRILRPGGVAVLPVPLVAEKTVEYPGPNEAEFGHVRAPGLDYFDRYRRHFARVELYRSDSFPEVHQLWIYEDRTRWPSEDCPLRPGMAGVRHLDFVPVCYS